LNHSFGESVRRVGLPAGPPPRKRPVARAWRVRILAWLGLDELRIEVVVTEELLHWDARAEELIGRLKDHWSTWPRAELRPGKLPIPQSLYDLRKMSDWFLVFQRSTANDEE
jgi:hypothetical protein